MSQRIDFPYLPESCAPDAPRGGLWAAARALAGVSAWDSETGDASEGPAWFALFEIRPGESVETMYAAARESDPEALPELAAVYPNPGTVAGFIYGRDSDGFEILGVWSDSDRLARAWNTLTGEYRDPVRAFALRAAANDSKYRIRKGHGFRIELAEGFRGTGVAFLIVPDAGKSKLIQGDGDTVPLAECFGYVRRGPFGCECYSHGDGSEPCPNCGKEPTEYISEAADYISELAGTGTRAEDPGYFTECE